MNAETNQSVEMLINQFMEEGVAFDNAKNNAKAALELIGVLDKQLDECVIYALAGYILTPEELESCLTDLTLKHLKASLEVYENQGFDFTDYSLLTKHAEMRADKMSHKLALCYMYLLGEYVKKAETL